MLAFISNQPDLILACVQMKKYVKKLFALKYLLNEFGILADEWIQRNIRIGINRKLSFT
ncbi:hypothetical protein EDF67_104271 [Sphingobacterium sp. JUb78]|nr:hypothetical protein [Sphingobacterium kitahiroshimense]TCR11178.1 hypothetical protein EDF67_104271 [Sphingobacterium sp. JUb78]